ncbi:hypothetical protein TG4357_03726 [Thalassovita gelatinovora]|uniref:Uncharacterized protein n=1 Tax=Thalassovita gelatinovora TaxID=53501 RepID=A0A0P1G476_THAGE|nr:hypothetical protein [Thalassovita gelatinovora]QIZ79060.1 hypothetical protein HFZ77_00505 [Thalassovita gelatinovora]CUH68664.1 hypothetical protein TG4357_03726 [Thalassovita gelatinovora]SEQ56333.1 hypothetical protein SAMN04488043_106187 [Thalassovita gelatinovora]
MTTAIDLLGRQPVMRDLPEPEPEPAIDDWRGEGFIRSGRHTPSGLGFTARTGRHGQKKAGE